MILILLIHWIWHLTYLIKAFQIAQTPPSILRYRLIKYSIWSPSLMLHPWEQPKKTLIRPYGRKSKALSTQGKAEKLLLMVIWMIRFGDTTESRTCLLSSIRNMDSVRKRNQLPWVLMIWRKLITTFTP
jgi:hypothetical protein